MITQTEKKALFIVVIFLATGFVSRYFALRKKIFHPSVHQDAPLISHDSQHSEQNSDSVHHDANQTSPAINSQIVLRKDTYPEIQVSSFLLNLNTASATELQRINGIGPKLANAIIEFRNKNGPFQRLSHLTRVRGIGDKKMKKFTPFLRIE